MTSSSYTFFALLLAVHGSLQKSSPTSPTYKAAVVEFNPVLYRNDTARTQNENTFRMETYIEQAAEKNADIIVFPELIPTTVALPPREYLRPWSTEVPDPTRHYAPCGSNDTSMSDVFKRFACAAKRHEIYVAVNLIERKDCEGKDCPLDGLHYYVTTAVFDRNGIVISRYRKSNMIDTPAVFSVVTPPEMATFTTDFGVTFGHIICFDILFQKSWMDVARKLNVTDFIFQAAWFVTLPFLVGLQLQASWSYAEDINLLAAGYNWAKEGYTGSGIYAGRQGIITATIGLVDYDELLIADVPKKIKNGTSPSTAHDNDEENARLPNEDQGYRIQRVSFRQNDTRFYFVEHDHYSLNRSQTKVIARNGSVVEELSHNGIQCRFELNVTNLSPPATYRLLAYNGPLRCNEALSIGIRICSVLSCANDTLESCGRIHDTSTVFQSIAVTAIYKDRQDTIMAPNSLGMNLFPLRHWVFEQRKQGEDLHTFMYLPKPTRDVISFGIWGRNYDEYITSP